MRFLLMQCFAIEEWGLVYQKVDRDKMISKYRLNRKLLDDN